jgi:S1-C subfamily serine protease
MIWTVKIVTEDAFGTGVIISEEANGFILTNHHVIEGNHSVVIVFLTDTDVNCRSFGNVIKIDEISDLALIQLTEPELILCQSTFLRQRLR